MATILRFEIYLLCIAAVLAIPLRMPAFTYVTSLWNVDQLSPQQLTSVKAFLNTDQNIIIFGDQQAEKFVWHHRQNSNNTNFALKNANWFKNKWWAFLHLAKHPSDLLTFGSFDNDTLTFAAGKQLQEVGARLGRLSLLREAIEYDKFDSEYLYWVDSELMTYPLYSRKNKQFMRKHNIWHKLAKDIQHPFNLRTYNNSEIEKVFSKKEYHGMGQEVRVIEHASSEWMGGKKQAIIDVSNLYDNLLLAAIKQQFPLNTQVLLTTMLARYPYIVKPIHLKQPLAFLPFELNNYRGPFQQTTRHLNLTRTISSPLLHFEQHFSRPSHPIYATNHQEYSLFIDYRFMIEVKYARYSKCSKFVVMMGMAIVMMRLMLWGLKETITGQKQIRLLVIQD